MTTRSFISFLCLLPLINFCFCDSVANLRQLTFGFSASNPKFSPDGKRVAFGTLGTLKQVYTVSTEIPYARPHRISTGIGNAIPLDYRPDGDFVYATDAFQYTNLTEAFNATIEGKLKQKHFDIVVTNFLGNFKHRYATVLPTVIVAVSKNAKYLAVLENGLQIIDIFSGSRTSILTSQGVTSAVFSPNHEQLFFTQTIVGGGTELLSVFTNGTGIRSIFKAPGEFYALSDVTKDGKHIILTHCKVGNIKNDDDDCFLASYNHESQALKWILLSGNRLQGTHAYFNDDGSKIAFVRLDEEFTDVFVCDWIGEGNEIHKQQRKKKPIKKIKTKAKSSRYAGMISSNHSADGSGSIVFEGERHLQNIRQLTFTGQNAEGYFAFQSNSIIYQAAGGDYGSHCDEIYRLNYNPDSEDITPQRLSSGLGSCTCSYLMPDDKRAIFASTFLEADPAKINDQKIGTCAEKKCQSPRAQTDPILKQLCNTSYTWDLHPSYDIFLVDEYGNFLERITDSPGYDAEGAISPDGKLMVFTSVRSGDPELWIYNFETKKFKQLTHDLGYDGGPFFSPDGKKIGFRASRPQTPAEITKYKQLLSYNLVEPLAMELYTINIDGTGMRRINKLGNSNWAPFYLNDNRRIVFSSNMGQQTFGIFNLYVINDDGTGLEQITNSNGFEAFPMLSRDGRTIIWASSRNAKAPTDLNLFIAQWVD
jgi:TolB protein